ncbi:GIY-YIG nuclease family protein [Nostoc sp. CALU 546]|uniref:GIY-YIG nuclease family protein n=2 Tax=Nostoc sp. CALU 546 TaxID=1867241 RepID=UPI003B6844B5
MKPGYIYLIHSVGTYRYKIGLTVAPRTPEDRLKELNSRQSPYPLKLIHYVFVADVYKVEKEIHQACKSFNVYREWFEFTKNAYLQQVIQLMERSNVAQRPNNNSQGYGQYQNKINLSLPIIPRNIERASQEKEEIPKHLISRRDEPHNRLRQGMVGGRKKKKKIKKSKPTVLGKIFNNNFLFLVTIVICIILFLYVVSILI